MAIGGVVLVWIAWKLLKGGGESNHEVRSAATFWGAMQTIVIADAAMGLDNVLAVAGAAQGSFALVVFGLVVSVPIVVWGSTLILKWVERFPWIVHIGVAVLAWTAAKMIVSEPLLQPSFAAQPAMAVALYVVVIGGVFASVLLPRRAGVRS
jgi:YjbE family integral membrane protein